MTTDERSFQQPLEPTRLRSFARFFKSYMSVSSIVVASLPIPVASLGLVPAFSSQRKLLSVFSSLFCFLTLGFIFSLRHMIARAYFPHIKPFRASKWIRIFRKTSMQVLPCVMIVSALFLTWAYLSVYRDAHIIAKAEQAAMTQKGELATSYLYEIMNSKTPTKAVHLAQRFLARAALMTSVGYDSLIPICNQIAQEDAAAELGMVTSTAKSYLKASNSTGSVRDLVDTYAGAPKRAELSSDPPEDLALHEIPFSLTLIMLYILMFVFAEAAFILMAIKEYLQDLLHLREQDLIQGTTAGEKSISVHRDVPI